jgi:hypothetical protein
MIGQAQIGITILALVLGGCAASASPGWDDRFGDANRVLNAQQVIDPAAPTKNAQAAPPADGRTVREAAERHVDSYRNPPAPTVINIGVGAGSAGR